jgi:hypothetical protein
MLTALGPGNPEMENRNEAGIGPFAAKVSVIFAVVPPFTVYCPVPNVSVIARATVTVAGSIKLRTGVPPVPVNCMATAPATAAVATFTVIFAEVCPLANVTGAAVTPAGNPAAVTVTAPVNPACRVNAIVNEAFPPGVTAAVGPVTVNPNCGAACTVSVNGTEALYPVPTTRFASSAYVPTGTVFATTTLAFTAVPNVTGPPSVHVTPAGAPVTVIVPAPLSPPIAAGNNEYTAVSPAFTTRTAGVAVMVTDGIAHRRIAVYKFSRPPVEVFPASVGIMSTDANKCPFNSAVVAVQLDSNNAAAPATNGVAIDVPFIDTYCPFRYVD